MCPKKCENVSVLNRHGTSVIYRAVRILFLPAPKFVSSSLSRQKLHFSGKDFSIGKKNGLRVFLPWEVVLGLKLSKSPRLVCLTVKGLPLVCTEKR